MIGRDLPPCDLLVALEQRLLQETDTDSEVTVALLYGSLPAENDSE